MNNQYLDVFLEEAREHIQDLNKNLLELEQYQDQRIIDEIFRSAHTIKGMAGTMGFIRISKITHEMENLLQELRSGDIDVYPEIIDILLEGVDFLEVLLQDIVENAVEKERDINSYIDRLRTRNFGAPTVAIKQDNTPKPSSYNFNEYEGRVFQQAFEKGLLAWEINVTLAEDCLLKSARAFLVFKTLENYSDIIKTIPLVQEIEDEKFDNQFTLYIVSSQKREEIQKSLLSISEVASVEIEPVHPSDIETAPTTNGLKAEALTPAEEERDKDQKGPLHIKKTSKTLRVDIDRLDNLMNLVSELIIIKTRLDDLDDSGYVQEKREAVEYLERITSNLHNAVMKVRMVPIENVFNRFPRVVHDLARELSKKIALVIEGADTELDRTIIDEIGDPLIHLIRNSADHGIESPRERLSQGKPEQGTIKLKAFHDGNNVVIEISDDGIGIQVDCVLEKAIRSGLIDRSQSTNLREQEKLSYIFEPGFSTKGDITDLSGRGVGLDVVKTKIESLGGTINLTTRPGAGTVFSIKLPLTLAIIQALMIMVGPEKYAIPLSNIKETVTISTDEIKMVQKNEVILLRGNVIPIFRLNKLLGIESENQMKHNLTLVIVRKGEKDFGIAVDNLIGQQEIVIKSLGSFLKSIDFIAGATILGDGTVALILDVNTLV